MLVALIAICEILFWVVLLSGLVARYVLRLPRTSAVLVASAPAVDLILLVASVLDLRRGGVATTVHALAAIYIGVSIGFGHSMLRWADERFAHRFADGPAPAPKPRYGRAHAARERAGWVRHLVAWAIGAGLMMTAVLVIDDPARTEALRDTARVWTLVLGVDAIISLSYTFSPRRERGSSREPARMGAGETDGRQDARQ